VIGRAIDGEGADDARNALPDGPLLGLAGDPDEHAAVNRTRIGMSHR
jgi:hypothetical protein